MSEEKEEKKENTQNDASHESKHEEVQEKTHTEHETKHVDDSEKPKAEHETKHSVHHEKKEDTPHHEKANHAHHTKKENKSKHNLFAYATIILGIILIAVLISGNNNTTLDKCTNKLNSIKENYPSLANFADSAVSSIKDIEAKLNTKDNNGGNVPSNFDGKQVKVDFYVMSQCPYGTQVEDAIGPVLKKLGSAVDFNVNFIANDNTDKTFKSLHGQAEVEGDLVQLCAMKYNPDKYVDLILCMNKNARAIPGNWEKCAKDNGLDVDSIKTCYEGDESKTLLSDSIKKSEAINARGSPTIYINDKSYTGARGENDFFRAICQEFDNAPTACSDIPEPKKVDMIVISDKRCEDCDASGLIGQLKSIFPGLDVTTYDYSDSEGKTLYDDNNLTFLPAFLFTDNVKDGEGYSNVQRYLVKTGDYLSLQAGATFDPNAEICGNNIDDDGDGLTDCEDSDCKSEWQCMEKLDKPVVDLFVMSYCPYGTQMEKGTLPVIDALGNSVDWNIRFVYYSMHGEKEVTEQHLQYCIQKETPDVYFDYLKCFLEDGNTDKCLTANSLTKDQYSTCLKESDAEFNITANYDNKDSWLSGKFPMFDTDKALNAKYGVQGSPTLVVNGVKVENQARDPASILSTICQGFKNKPEACNAKLPSVAYSTGLGFTKADQSSNTDAAAACGV